jgi:GWxTD domain-containing protein
MKAIRWLLVLGLLGSCAAPAAAQEKPGMRLGHPYAEFLSQVRYLISKEERKQFLALPDEQKPQFIEEFWKKRDTDPATPTNEFKEEYLDRIRQADNLFFGETQAGWLTDRGRIYVLYGPPSRRETAKPAIGQTGICLETWYYDDFPVVFADRNCGGTFTLRTKELGAIAGRDIAAAAAARSSQEPTKLPFDFIIHILKRNSQRSVLEGLVRLEMAYGDIWFDAKEGVFGTTFAVEMTLEDSQKVTRWQYKNKYPVSLTAAELKKKQKDIYGIEVPMTIENDVETLRAGRCRLTIVVENETSKERIRKVAEFSF